MLKINQNRETIIINTKLITYATAYTDWGIVTKPYKVFIKFTKDNDFLVHFSTEKEQEQFLNELMSDMDKG